ncbi:outer membrane lipoprotein-sorting protein [Dissulfurirhabdus thermomarina]|uniref:Outer membrane lipoprotein-sorting protein n=1 Tax=Dissulfurirhabdus thermomarina TaxID=1765737 RepID=A0A6N9TQ66_DISTH|nr:outer membrane lipoprotein-sorting protein [Dissulfurirhabdus thermomarina]NDY41577.1 outer membrane lipoprotein-sorting protein [Dissulfurirhabdus thermomarina]NMX22368.1 outer membrane lipoprotein-sorting protein [Dissulfurirhabdus thermomarina]
MKTQGKMLGILAVATWILWAAGPAGAAGPSVSEIVEKANLMAYYQGRDGKARVQMTIVDSQGRKRERNFVILRKDKEDGGDQYYYVYFHRPSDVRKMIFMVWKHPGKDDDRWLYLPALDLVKRIAATDKRSSFVGSDFLYEDVSGRSITEDEHELVETTDRYYVLKNTPKDPASVEFGYYKVWVDRATFLPVRAEYYDRAGKKYRVIEALEIRTIQGYPTVVKSRVSNLETGSVTTLEFSEIKYDIGLSDRIFTERYLRRPPREARR